MNEQVDQKSPGELSLPGLVDILGNINDAVWSFSWPELVMLFASPATERIYGRPPAAFIEQPDLWRTMMHPDDRHLADRIIEQLQAEGMADLEYRIVRQDETLGWVRDKRRLVYDDQQRPLRVDGSISDITTQKQAHEALRVLAESGNLQEQNVLAFLVGEIAASQGKRHVLIAEIPPGQPDLARTVAVCSDGKLVENFSYHLADTPCRNVVNQGVCFYPRNIRQLFPRDQLLQEMEVESYWGTPLFATTGETIGLLAIIDDRPMAEEPHNTALLKSFAVRAAAELERRHDELQRDLMISALSRSSQEMKRLAEVMAHHLQEPTRRLVTFAQRLRKSFSSDQESRESLTALDFIEYEAWRLRALVNDIQQYLSTEAQPPQAVASDVREVLAAEERRLAPRLAEINGRLEIGELPAAPLDVSRLQKLFSVLLDNAIGHATGHHPLLIRVSGESLPGLLRFKVEDNGPGIALEQRKKVFNLFEKLDSSQAGTGLGLAIARRIVDGQGGWIGIGESELGGTAVIIELPRRDGEG
ncbi:sensor histidine kinase [Desulfurivibrio alkaliphilus]|uniref:histidine kinase n=1 Tax=Desulfurivibrio alkaliphilus (strain DSM 19089 / UNIQEM U267 / AHT2) TaxID=589865 RepID=D6Z1D1_DESAT|nr:PAS domain-containing sensor histidine kinase [Desulfurivibrio alkaliphilus]ADH85386.1 multi-sensor signal transduction histidine kinase [Desulfurivibrio alkaliphilus AHT 2]